ncbi:MAG: hypothetical protein KJ072_27760 [Verrucomicrobia bacterium]|nr:hypothetical protein [Verrucomicrobiota bacterium]
MLLVLLAVFLTSAWSRQTEWVFTNVLAQIGLGYLMAFATPIEVWHAASDRKLERDWVGLLESEPRFSCPIARFGSSDYHRSRTSHLFFSKRRPSFQWFEQRVRAVFEPNVRAQRAVLAGDNAGPIGRCTSISPWSAQSAQ